MTTQSWYNQHSESMDKSGVSHTNTTIGIKGKTWASPEATVLKILRLHSSEAAGNPSLNQAERPPSKWKTFV